jgi:hypothetical protein
MLKIKASQFDCDATLTFLVNAGKKTGVLTEGSTSLQEVPARTPCIPAIVWTYGHLASRIPVFYVFCRLLKNTSKIRPFSKLEGRGPVFCPKGAKSSNLEAFYGAHLCEDLTMYEALKC